MVQLKANGVILFQGDSITDCGRNREDAYSLGGGYVHLVAAQLGYLYPEKNLTVLNRGISGHRVVDLEQRWQEDCLDLKPDVLSILIGINDTWRRYDNNSITTAEQYYEGYRRLITRSREQFDAELVIIEPFVLPFPDDRRAWREDLDPKIKAARALAEEFKTEYIPLDGLFAAHSMKSGAAHWAYDGVHPTSAGHALIADAWLKTVKV